MENRLDALPNTPLLQHSINPESEGTVLYLSFIL